MTADPLSQLEAQLRLADAAGKAPSYADLADMVRRVRETDPPSQQGEPVLCRGCFGTGVIATAPTQDRGFIGGAPETCPDCEGTGMHTIPQDQGPD